MGLFNRIRPTFVTPPAEPGLLAIEDQVEAVDRQLRLYANTPASLRHLPSINRLLDQRLTIRPPRVCDPAAVPVSPGRPS
jgi:hypothetical protein